MPDIPDVGLTLSVEPQATLRRRRAMIGQGIRIHVRAFDRATGLPVSAGADPSLTIYPPATVAEPIAVPINLPTAELTADGSGQWYADIGGDKAGMWIAYAAMTAPRSAAAEIAFDVTTSGGVVPNPAAPMVTTADLYPVLTQGGGVLTAVRHGALPAVTTADRNAAVLVALDGASKQVALGTVLDAAGGAGTDAGAAAGASAGSAAGTTAGTAAGAASGATAGAAAGATAGADAAAPVIAQAAADALTATTKAGEAVASADAAVVARDIAIAAQQAASDQAIAAAGAVTGITAPAIPGVGLSVAGADGGTYMEVLADGSDWQTVPLRWTAMPDGSVRIARPDLAALVTLLAGGGVGVGGAASAFLTDIDNSDLIFAAADLIGDTYFEFRRDGSFAVAGLQFRLVSGRGEIADLAGNTLVSSPADGVLGMPGGSVQSSPIPGLDTTWVNSTGDIVAAIDNAGNFLGNFPTAALADGFTAVEIATYDGLALAKSGEAARQVNTNLPLLTNADINLIAAYGQSLSWGHEGYPNISRYSVSGCLMVGDSTSISDDTLTAWAACGTSQFNPLIGAIRPSAGAPVAAQAAIDAMAAGATPHSSERDCGELNFLRRAWYEWRGIPLDSAHALVSMQCGQGGMSIAALSKGASPEYYNRIATAAATCKGLATSGGKSSQLAAVSFLQGETDMPITPLATYQSAVLALRADINADTAVGVFGQARMPGFYTYQTGGSWVRDVYSAAPAQAQLDLTLSQPNWFLTGPAYPVTDKVSGHLDANGYRWLGVMFGKVQFRTMVLRQGWRPLYMLGAVGRGSSVLVYFNVPAPPLQFALPYVVNTATDYANKGLVVADVGGDVAISSVALAGAACVLITLARPLVGAFTVAAGTFRGSVGNTCICDSDGTQSYDNYEYFTGSSFYASANIPALVDKPYPLNNWCCIGTVNGAYI